MNVHLFFRRAFWVLVGASMLAVSCQKKDQPPKSSGNGAYGMEDSLKFYTWFYALSDSDNLAQYYWNDQVPDLNPFSSQFANADSLLAGQNGIASYPEVNGKKVDRYSFLDRTGAVSDQIEGGQLGNKGMEITWVDEGSTTSLWVVYTYGNSPAGNAGVQRGWQIVKVNNSSDVGYDGPGYGDGSSQHLQTIVNAVYTDASATFTFRKPSGEDTTIDLANATYSFNPVLMDSVYTVDGTKVGYLVFSSFVSVYNYDDKGNVTGGTATKDSLDAAFQRFSASGVKDLIVDLRYNGGGAVNTAEYLDNLIAPASANGKEMYEFLFNKEWTDLYNQLNYPQDVDFSDAGGLGLDHVFFIVGPDTYSASELTINNLKPYMDVKLVGETTGGKPVGFSPQPIMVWNDTTQQEDYVADLYAINFETKNALKEGGYFFGMTPDYEAKDFVDVNWGDTEYDNNLSAIFNYIKNGSFSRSSARLRSGGAVNLFRQSPSPALNREFKGMVDYRMRFRNQLIKSGR